MCKTLCFFSVILVNLVIVEHFELNAVGKRLSKVFDCSV